MRHSSEASASRTTQSTPSAVLGLGCVPTCRRGSGAPSGGGWLGCGGSEVEMSSCAVGGPVAGVGIAWPLFPVGGGEFRGGVPTCRMAGRRMAGRPAWRPSVSGGRVAGMVAWSGVRRSGARPRCLQMQDCFRGCPFGLPDVFPKCEF